MNINKIEGVILQAITFKEADQILTVFTEAGLIKLFFGGGLSKRKGKGALTNPLQQAEFVFKQGQNEISSCSEISVINSFLRLRQKLIYLTAAGEMANALLVTQHLNQPAPLLYQLFIRYLENISEARDPRTLAASLKLKVLRHEGILSLEKTCTICDEEWKNLHVFKGECFCEQHAPIGACVFSHEEADLLIECTYGRSLNRLKELTLSFHFLEKIIRLFKETII